MKGCSVILRAFEQEDYKLINKWRNDPEMQMYTVGRFRYVSPEMERAWVHDKMMNNTTDIYFAICINDETKRMIGYTSINNIDFFNRSAYGGGTVIGEKDCQDGIYLHDTLLLIMRYVFITLGLNRFDAMCMTIHPSSPIILESFGFKLEGIKRQAIYQEGVFHDLCMYALMKDDYLQLLADNQYTLMAFAQRVALIRKVRKQNKQ